jgi:heme/copper-type cytochrome/quinol oxidase subunit 3
MEIDIKNNEHKMGMCKPWSSWKSPVGLGIFLLTSTLAFAILLYTLLNLVVSVGEALHPAAASQGMSAQELQQLEQQVPAQGGAATQ